MEERESLIWSELELKKFYTTIFQPLELVLVKSRLKLLALPKLS